MKKENNITPFEQDVGKWYSDLVLQSELISYAPVKGTMFFKPYGYAIWNNITKFMTLEFEKKDIEEVKFPLLFPESLLIKEKEHLEGFSPEVLKVENVGGKKINDPLVIRPTSEVLFGTYFKENIKSYSQLPIKLNQWVNILRWENNTRPFLRNTEFFWQEGHTSHSTAKEAKEFSKEILTLYKKFVEEFLLLPTISGEKTKSERFAGAENTYTIETILKDGQALQSGTSHFLGDNFAKAFNVKVQGKDNKKFYPFQTSWGVSTRLIGSLIMAHSDNKGLILPSKIAPFQVVILTLFSTKNTKVLDEAKKIKKKLSILRVNIDDKPKGIGYKSREWEIKGAPIRIEIGPKDLENKSVTLSIRNKYEKIIIKFKDLNLKIISDLLNKFDKEIYNSALKIKEDKKIDIKNIDKIKEIVEQGKYALGYWIENKKVEKEIKDKTGATIRCLIKTNKKGKDIVTGKDTEYKAIFARAY